MIKRYIPYKWISKEVALYVFLELDGVNSRELLERCYNRGVSFTPGDTFFVDQKGYNTLRLGFSRLSKVEIEIGIKVIGEEVKELLNKSINK